MESLLIFFKGFKSLKEEDMKTLKKALGLKKPGKKGSGKKVKKNADETVGSTAEDIALKVKCYELVLVKKI